MIEHLLDMPEEIQSMEAPPCNPQNSTANTLVPDTTEHPQRYFVHALTGAVPLGSAVLMRSCTLSATVLRKLIKSHHDTAFLPVSGFNVVANICLFPCGIMMV